MVLRVLKDRCLTWVFLDSMEALLFRALVIIFLPVCVYGCVSIANFVKYLKNALLALLGQRRITHTCSFIYCFNMGWLLFFPFPTLLLSLVCICLFFCPSACLCVCLCVCLSVSLPVCRSFYLCVCLSMCLCVCMSVRASVCLYVIMYYIYMYVVFIVINVCKLLHVRRPTSSPRAVWNPCKINKALN